MAKFYATVVVEVVADTAEDAHDLLADAIDIVDFKLEGSVAIDAVGEFSERYPE